MTQPAVIRDAAIGDVEAICTINNVLIPSTTTTWTERGDTVEERWIWFAEQTVRGFPVLVADLDGQVVGFASYGHFRGGARKEGYHFVVEHSIHVLPSAQGQGIGVALMDALIERAIAAELFAMIGGIDGANGASIAFHERLGFVEVGRLPGIGFKFGQRLDLVLMQRSLQ